MLKHVLNAWLMLAICMLASGCNAAPSTWMGANVKVSANAPWESDAAAQSLNALADTGASKALLIAFVWQATPQSNDPVLGSDSSLAAMRAALRQSHAAGLQPTLKVHLWIPGHWAGDAAPADQAAWFAAYQRALLPLAQLAEDEHAEALVIGTELRQLQDAPQWPALVAAVRAVYGRKLLYVADGMEHAETFRYWSLFDAVGTSLYPRLSEAAAKRRPEMEAAAQRLQDLGKRVGKPVWVAELGLRSARGSLAAPWESPEQRTAAVDTKLQLQVLQQWRAVLQAHGVEGIALWCWYTDPKAGGPGDSDFTVQGKPAQRVLAE
ncbi:glycosidase-like protein [Xanthomonas campestris pv. campestris]|uniref:glycoside hydrolase family 113 n=1 Tax=Xanthomonas campestris TaxID=339 RepID=UPI001F4201F4|nr:glycosidase-like protein [Xanthomonas campestris]MEA9551181.1 glycosidase-like protein [Xanthomonas campestris]MEB1024799.1 glycosidase-like protein [Xanthomonas campestris pv. campestris]MEB1097832.1 glycosidase-like protein [Xanthomonas campestris pv. campestris]MEB1133113.1 glycosidase-like protein [Xanthomonas campestris pv. campestris]MEB1145828.1 glycosidase-like protein [Xanthomonas campestris pv. campestris]